MFCGTIAAAPRSSRHAPDRLTRRAQTTEYAAGLEDVLLRPRCVTRPVHKLQRTGKERRNCEDIIPLITVPRAALTKFGIMALKKHECLSGSPVKAKERPGCGATAQVAAIERGPGPNVMMPPAQHGGDEELP